MEIAPGIRRIGSGLVNVYLLEEAGEVTIVDAGVPGYWNDLPPELAATGRTLADVRAVVLTHGHSDHIGFAERIRAERGVPVSIHELDAALARGEVPNPAKGLGRFRLTALASFMLWGARHGALHTTPLVEVATFGDGAMLDVPGSPQVVLVPGHTPGSAALHVRARSALLVGDILCTRDVLTGATGPRIAPFTADRARALASLSRLLGLDARLVLPGHGEAWTEGIDAAIRAVRRTAASTTGTSGA